MKRLLLVDDCPERCVPLRAFFQRRGFEVATAGFGRMAFEESQRTPPDAMILDLILPDIHGVELCRKLRESPKTRHAPILLVTAFKAGPADRIAGLRSGADDFLCAPFTLEELSERLHAALRRAAPAPRPAGLELALAGLLVPETKPEPPLPEFLPAAGVEALRDAPALARRLVLEPVRALEGLEEDRDHAPALCLLGATGLLEGLALIGAAPAGAAWLPLLLLGFSGAWLSWLALSSCAFIALPFMGSEASWRRISTIAACAGVPRLLGAALSITYAATAAAQGASEFHAFSTGFDLVAAAPVAGLGAWVSRIGLIDAWWAGLSAWGLTAGCRVPAGRRRSFMALVGSLALVLGLATGY
ncbi:MAG: response regulator [Elusimicrobia bacterium]|nr:response regulator [Elusimicrobiota bacterium]